MNNQKGFAHLFLIFFLLIGLVVTVYMVGNPLTFFTRASEADLRNKSLEQLTADLVQTNNVLNGGGRSAQEDKMAHLRVAAAIRKDKLIAEGSQNPNIFVKNATLASQRGSFPADIQDLIEQDITVSGKAMVTLYDMPEAGKAEINYSIKDSSNKFYQLLIAQTDPKLITGANVEIKGVALGDVIGVPSDGINKGRQAQAIGVMKTKGNQNIAVILVNFTDLPTPAISKSEVEKIMFDRSDPTSVARYYEENSLGHLVFTGTVFDGVTIDAPHANCQDREANEWVSETYDYMFNTKGIDLRKGYNRVILVFPKFKCTTREGLPIAGIGTLGGYFDTQTEANAQYYIPSWSYIISNHHERHVYIHELGHNLGLDHSNSLDCGKKAIDVYSQCKNVEYGDYLNPMGLLYQGFENKPTHFAPAHKAMLDWLGNSAVGTTLRNVQFTIKPIEVPTSGIQVLKVPKEDTQEEYYIGYRQPIGLDEYLARGVLIRGVTIYAAPRIVTYTRDEEGNYLSSNTKLLNMNNIGMLGKMPNVEIANLFDGQVFYDPINKIAIKQLSHDKDGAKIELMINVQTAPPSISPLDPPQSSPQPTSSPAPQSQSCGANQRMECLGYAGNGINAYCWEGSTYKGGVCNSNCAKAADCGVGPAPSSSPQAIVPTCTYYANSSITGVCGKADRTTPGWNCSNASDYGIGNPGCTSAFPVCYVGCTAQ